jgi:insulysin
LASEAGLSFSASPTYRGMVLTFSGFSENQPRFIVDVLEAIRDLRLDAVALDKVKSRAQSILDEYATRPPINILMSELQYELVHYMWPNQLQIEFIQKAKLGDVERYINDFWRQSQLQILVYGNYTEAEAKSLGQAISSSLPMTPKKVDLFAAPNRQLQAGKTHTAHISNPTPAALIYTRVSTEDDIGALVLLGRMLNDHAFHHLRNEKTIGYAVMATMMEEYRQRGFLIAAQTSDMSSQKLAELLTDELSAFGATLGKLDQRSFQRHKDGAVAFISTYKQSMESRAFMLLDDLTRHGKPVDEAALAMEQLKTLSLEDFRRFAETVLNPKAAQRMLLIAKDTESANTR